MNRTERIFISCFFIVLLLGSGTIVIGQTPPGPNTIQQGEGANFPTITATDGYFYGVPPVNITDRLFGDYTGLPLTGTTLDTGLGANELYDMDQNVLTTSDVEFNSVNIQELYYDSELRTDLLNYTELPYSYFVWEDENGIAYARNGTTGNIDFTGASDADDVTVINNALLSLTPGRTWLQVVKFKGVFEIPTGTAISVGNWTIMDCYGAEFHKIYPGATTPILVNSDQVNGNVMIRIYGGRRDSSER